MTPSTRILWNRIGHYLLLSLLLAVVGCQQQGELVPLSGVVSLDGQPLSGGTVTFFNVDDGPSGYARIETDGSYIARTGDQPGLKPGDYQITVVAVQAPATVERVEERRPQSLTPSRYAKPEDSGLTYTVTDDGGDFPIKLVSKP